MMRYHNNGQDNVNTSRVEKIETPQIVSEEMSELVEDVVYEEEIAIREPGAPESANCEYLIEEPVPDDEDIGEYSSSEGDSSADEEMDPLPENSLDKEGPMTEDDPIGMRLYVCNECDKSYTRSNKLRDHLLAKHGIKMPYLNMLKGNFKPELFNNEEAECSTANTSTGDNSLVNELTDQPTYFTTKIGKKVLLHYCQVCGRSFHRPVKLKAHLLKYHPDVGQPVNPLSTLYPNTSSEHFITAAGNKVLLHKCTSCDRSFHRPVKLKDHMLRYHPNLVEASSAVVPKPTSGDPVYFTNYLGKKTRLIECPECDRHFHRPAKLKAHQARHHGHLDLCTVCDICGLALTDAKSLNRHIYTIHGEGSKKDRGLLFNLSEPTVSKDGSKSRQYKCPECGQMFPRTSTLRKHLFNRHNMTLPFKSNVSRAPIAKPQYCTECSKVFTHKSRLSEHMFTAHQIKLPYK